MRDVNSYAAIEDGTLRVRFGWFFNNTFPLAAVGGARRERWPWVYGLGWRSNLAGFIGVVGSYSGGVVAWFKETQRVSGIVPFLKLRCDQLMLSLQEPQEFIKALSRAIE